MKPEIKKLLILNAPYLLFVYLFDKLGEAVRLAPGADASQKLLHIGEGFSAAFSSYAPSFHPADLLIGIAGALIIRLVSIQDDCIRKNPFDFQLNTVLEDTTEPKVPLTPAQEESLLAFVESDSVYEKYYDEIVILLGTGLRISELCGLTDADLDFEDRTINVDHQLLRSKETGYYIEKPKTGSGVRQIPMSEKVYEALKRVLANRKGAKDIVVDGYSGFLFLNRDGNPKVAWNYDRMFQQLVKKYNKCHEEALPKVMTPHTLRHTFCTNLANAGMNPKALQYIMGHSNITMTLNYYAHATYASAKAEMERLIAA